MGTEKEEMLHLLQEPDSVLRTDMYPILKKFISLGGQPELAVRLLSDSFKGQAHMAQLCCKWLALLGQGDKTEASYARNLVVSHFTPEKADTVFNDGVSKAPAWVEALVREGEGRKLLYELSERPGNKNCLLLNFAIHSIWKRGYADETEVAHVTAATAYFSVFHHVLCNKLQTLCGVAEEEALAASKSELRKMCTHSQFTYLYSQIILRFLAAVPGGQTFKHISEDLELHASKEHGEGTVLRLYPLLSAAEAKDREAAVLVCEVLCDPQRLEMNAMRLGVLYQCSQPDQVMEDASARPTKEWLQHPRFVRLLLSTLYKPANRAPQWLADVCMSLLALVASAAAEVHVPLDASPGDLSSLPLGDRSEDRAQREEMATVQTVKKALQECLVLLEHASSGRKVPNSSGVTEKQSHMHKAGSSGATPQGTAGATHTSHSAADEQQIGPLKVPIAAAGALAWVKCALEDSGFYSSIYHKGAFSLYMGILRSVASMHVRLHEEVLDALTSALRVKAANEEGGYGSTALLQAKKHMLNMCVWLMAQWCGRGWDPVEAVLTAIQAWADSADSSLVRHFVVKVLAAAAPPYSTVFQDRLVELMRASSLLENKTAHEDDVLDHMEVAKRPRLSRGLPSSTSLEPNLNTSRKRAIRHPMVPAALELAPGPATNSLSRQDQSICSAFLQELERRSPSSSGDPC